ncbi:cell adhesion molecule DSCAM-like isoform X2 [Ornithodoros turicata]|uniref:cell adhesion molecule DSCAM-like isoform X2 n=1 Tax=Ornithodoros turicata TaxID=34597 RepID=UPI0031399BBB
MAMAVVLKWIVMHLYAATLLGICCCSNGVLSLLHRGPSFTLEPPPLVEFTNSTGADVRCHADDSSLTFRPFSRDSYQQSVHAAFYRCVATNAVGTIISRMVHVLGVLDERVLVRVVDDIAVRGNTAVLRCNVHQSQAPYTAFDGWIRDDGFTISRPSYNDERYTVLHTGELLVHRTNMADTERTYRCRVRHTLSGDAATSSNTARAIVTDMSENVPPRMTYSVPKIDVGVGRHVELPCVATAFPPANVTWYRLARRQLELVPTGAGARQLNGVLTFDVAGTHMSGTYVCVAKNDLGESRTESVVHVNDVSGASLVPNYQAVEPGKTATLNCSVTSGRTNPLHVTWFKDGRQLKTDGRVRSITPTRLKIDSLQREDGGMYQCFVGINQDGVQAAAEVIINAREPTLSQVFYQKTAKPSESMALQCQSEGTPRPVVTWTRNDEPVFSDARIRISSDRASDHVISVLNFSRVRLEDSAVYACVAKNDVGTVVHSARLNVLGTLFMHRESSNATVVAGQDVTLKCPYGGFPVESVTWYKDDHMLPRNNRQSVDDDGNLHIRDAQHAGDAGDYACVVKGYTQEVRATTHLVFVVPPVIDDHFFPETITVDEGSRSRLLCSVSRGDGPIQFQWLKDGRPLSSVPDASLQFAEDSAMIKFRRIRFKDSGKYTCFAINDASQDNRTTEVIVNVSPRLKDTPRNTTATQGRSVVLQCSADGFPTPTITWKKQGLNNEFEPLNLNFGMHILPNGSLLIRSPEEGDEGIYRCEARNQIGAAATRDAALVVYEPPKFKERYRVLYIRQGETFNTECSVSFGDAPLSFSWEKNYRPLNCSRCLARSTSHSSELTILSTTRKDSALYSCSARNHHGKDTTFFQVVVQEPPDAPTTLLVSNETSRTAALHWQAPFDGNSEIIKYKLHYKVANELMTGATFEATVAGTETSTTLTNLKPVSKYEVRVSAENAFGSSSPSNSTIVHTKEEAPSGPPTAVSLYTTGSQSLKVTWRPPSKDHHHGTILGYYVSYRVADGESPAIKQVDARNGNSSHGLETTYLTNLRRLTKYGVMVQAYNGAGKGPPSEEVYATTLETAPPTSPSVQVEPHSTNSVYVRWKKDPKDRSQNTEYVLHYGGDDGEWKKHTLAAQEKEFLLRNLRCGSQYRLYVTASNSLGMGEPGEESLVRTKGGPPVAPSQEGFIVANKTSAVLRLSQWSDGGCPINRFVLQYRQKLEPRWASISETLVPPRSGSHTLSNLLPGKVYVIAIVAHSEAGATRAEFEFVTPSHKATKTTTEPMSGTSNASSRFPLQENLVFIVPALLSAFIVVLVIGLFVFYSRKQSPRPDVTTEKDLTGRKVYVEDAFIIAELPRKPHDRSDTSVACANIFDSQSKRSCHIYTTNQSAL